MKKYLIFILFVAVVGAIANSSKDSLKVAATTTSPLTWTFTWTDPNPTSIGITNYNLYEVSSVNTLVASVPVSLTPKYTLDGSNLARGTHTYVVTCVNPDGESVPSNQASITVKKIPAAPTNLVVSQP